ncbi:3-deoxy-D-manno-octulosonic acid kinase [Alteromonas sp. ASW11-36]|uniref:3-deoxy-D-manno-octulosonic acid kinase n=1 Tax=Alteromonas arenosi TaxID=3055817 RepID=A0ABT7SSU9_9ALTE|nr:3-deoxy-D-manno-octulosonic acid kinase [Alteromonas sp. ASW11-36]MDM7859273.1 3-deoxy-D-manno-octulosonic acid kinase [Alteromonas sp. ASW11-36]
MLEHRRDTNSDLFIASAQCAELDLPTITTQWFRADPTMTNLTLSGSAQGRGTTHFLRYGEHVELVLRHYKRGGLIGKILDDQFWFRGLKQTRPYRELALLEQMHQWRLPCPQPIAGRVHRSGFVWRGDLLTVRIPDALDTHNVLIERPLSEFEWRHIGATIKRFHQRQVYHHDLNIHNVMLDAEGQAWLIDFDKCAIRSGDEWKAQNLARLKRSLNKELARCATYHFSEENWPLLLEGYNH